MLEVVEEIDAVLDSGTVSDGDELRPIWDVALVHVEDAV